MDVLILLLLIVLNGVFAMSEIGVVSSRKARLQQLADEGRAGAGAALALAKEPSHFLSTVQIGITLIGITSGAFGEATIAPQLIPWVSQWTAVAPYAEQLSLAIMVTGITLTSVIVGELVPKRLALINPERVASLVARPMMWLAMLTYPVVRFLSAATEGLLRLFGVRGQSGTPVTEEEINVLMEQGAEAGVFQDHEQAIVARVFRLDELRVTGVMTTRNDVVYLDLNEPLERNLRRIFESGHSRFPVTRGRLEDIQGIVHTKTLLEDAVAGRPIALASRVTKPMLVPDTLTVMQVVETFKKHRQTIAVVIDEYGNPQGLVTLNDVMQALVGDIATAGDKGDLDVVQRDDGSWLIDGGVTIERFKDVLEIEEELPEEGTGSYHTLGGFVMLRLGRVPKVGDKCEWNAIEFEVVDMDGHRVDKMLVTRISAGESETAADTP
jgi:putative hemolysin